MKITYFHVIFKNKCLLLYFYWFDPTMTIILTTIIIHRNKHLDLRVENIVLKYKYLNNEQI